MTNFRSGKRAPRLWLAHPDHRNVQRGARQNRVTPYSGRCRDNPPVRRGPSRFGSATPSPAKVRRPLLERVLSCDPAKLMRLAPSVRNRLLAHAYAAGYGRPHGRNA